MTDYHPKLRWSVMKAAATDWWRLIKASMSCGPPTTVQYSGKKDDQGLVLVVDEWPLINMDDKTRVVGAEIRPLAVHGEHSLVLV